MKKILALCSIPAAVLAFTVACDDGSNVVPCTTDDDCTGLEDTPICDTELEQCVAGETGECESNVQCQIAYNGSNDAASAECTNDAGCNAANDEICVKGFGDVGFCVSSDPGGTTCSEIGGETVPVTKIDGSNANACLDPVGDRSCGDGTCDVK